MSSLSNNIPAPISTTNLNFGNDSNIMSNPNLPHGFVHRGVHHSDINAAISQFGLGFGHDLSAMHAQGTSFLIMLQPCIYYILPIYMVDQCFDEYAIILLKR